MVFGQVIGRVNPLMIAVNLSSLDESTVATGFGHRVHTVIACLVWSRLHDNRAVDDDTQVREIDRLLIIEQSIASTKSLQLWSDVIDHVWYTIDKIQLFNKVELWAGRIKNWRPHIPSTVCSNFAAVDSAVAILIFSEGATPRRGTQMGLCYLLSNSEGPIYFPNCILQGPVSRGTADTDLQKRAKIRRSTSMTVFPR
jgi:hypothetical protein